MSDSQEKKNRGPDLSAERTLVGNVVRHILRGDTETYTLKSAFGKSLQEADMTEYMAFLRVTASKDGISSYPNDDAAFIVTTMLCNRYAGKRNFSLSGTPYQKLLRRAYQNGTPSMKRALQLLIDTDFDEQGTFASKIAWVESLPEVKSGTPDFAAMLYDLKWWNAPEHWSRKKWARAMISNVQNSSLDAEGE